MVTGKDSSLLNGDRVCEVLTAQHPRPAATLTHRGRTGVWCPICAELTGAAPQRGRRTDSLDLLYLRNDITLIKFARLRSHHSIRRMEVVRPDLGPDR